jgi:hypothetical protein
MMLRSRQLTWCWLLGLGLLAGCPTQPTPPETTSTPVAKAKTEDEAVAFIQKLGLFRF